MLKDIERVLKLSDRRVDYLHNIDDKWFYKWYKTYIEWIDDEVEEVKEEIKENNSVYLEDELWDIFWDYMCLLNSLDQSKMIDKDKVFERCYKKFSWRLKPDWNNQDELWNDIKVKQKKELLEEHNNKYKK